VVFTKGECGHFEENAKTHCELEWKGGGSSIRSDKFSKFIGGVFGGFSCQEERGVGGGGIRKTEGERRTAGSVGW